MATITPTWTDNVSVLAAQTLARGSTVRATLDLRSKWRARLLIRIGRGGTTALTNGVDVQVRPTVNNNADTHAGAVVALRSGTAAAASTTVNSDSNSGQNALNVASSTGFAAGDLICITGASQARQEFARVAKVTAGVLTLDAPLRNTHTSAQADTVRNQAEAWPIEIEGGATYEVIIDYGDDSAGESVEVQALAQTLDSITSV